MLLCKFNCVTVKCLSTDNKPTTPIVHSSAYLKVKVSYLLARLFREKNDARSRYDVALACWKMLQTRNYLECPRLCSFYPSFVGWSNSFFILLSTKRERERERDELMLVFHKMYDHWKSFFFLFPFFFLPCNTLPLARKWNVFSPVFNHVHNNNSRFGRNVGSFLRCYARLLIPKKMYILYFGVFVIFCWHSGSFLFLDHRLSRGHPYNGSCPNRTVTRCQKMSKSHSTATSR